MNTLTNNIRQVLLVILFTMALFASYPYVFSQFIAMPNPILLNGTILCATFLIAITARKKFITFPSKINKIVIIQFVGYFLLGIIHNDKLDFVRCYFLIIVYLLLLCLYNTGTLLKYIKFNNYLLSLQCILGVVAFILFFIGQLSPIFPFENTDGRIAYCYGLTCSNAVVDNVIRVAGYFDEPGSLAFWGIYALILNKTFIDNKKVEAILIFCLLFTLSVAYYIQVLLYVLLYYGSNLKKNVFYIIFIVTLLVGFFIYVNNNSGSTLYQLTVGRFEVNKGSVTIESERSLLAERAKKVFESSPVIGVGQTNIRSGEYMGDNEYELLASDGIVGMFLIYFPLIVVARGRKSRKKFLFASTILFAGYLQRPFHCSVIHFAMFYIYVITAILYFNNKLYIQNR